MTWVTFNILETLVASLTDCYYNKMIRGKGEMFIVVIDTMATQDERRKEKKENQIGSTLQQIRTDS